jgi:hypothetical protein
LGCSKIGKTYGAKNSYINIMWWNNSLIYFITPIALKLILKLQLFILYMHKNWQKFLTCLIERKNCILHMLFFWTKYVFCRKSGLFQFLIFDYFEYFSYFIYVVHSRNSLDVQNKNLFGSFITACIISLYPLMSPHRKEMGKSSVSKFFDRKWRNTTP